MPSDVSDEALKAAIEAAFPGWGPARWLVVLDFARRIRDLTAARCVEACEEERERQGKAVRSLRQESIERQAVGKDWDITMQAEHLADAHKATADKLAATILALFPGAKP